MTPTPGSLLVTGLRIRVTPHREVEGNLRIVGSTIADPTAEHAGEVLDARGAVAVPLVVESALAAASADAVRAFDLMPGNPATFAVIRRSVAESEILRMLVVSPRDLVAVFVDGALEAREGEPVRPAGEDLAGRTTRDRWVATWVDDRRDMQQHLSADGRYAETRNGRPNAYTGRYWVRGDRITYLDDSGFWAFGQLVDGVLHHAGFVLHRRD